MGRDDSLEYEDKKMIFQILNKKNGKIEAQITY